MNCTMKNPIKYISYNFRFLVLIYIILSVNPQTSYALYFQDDDQLRSRISLHCVQHGDESIELVAKLRFRENRQYFNIPGVEVNFSGQVNDDITDLGSAITNENGEANLMLPESVNLTIGEDSLYTVYVDYEGNEQFGPSDNDFQFKKAKVVAMHEIVDSTYELDISAFQLDQNQTPIGDQDIFVMTPRLFSNLTLANDYSDEEGNLVVTIPSDVPASQYGSLELIVRIPDTDEYGTLETRVLTDWGVPQNNIDMATRALWTPDAPLWMVYTFAFLMLVVWGHYAVIIYKLYLVRAEGNKLNKENLT